MGTFGERLRREREMRGINLDEISTATKISTRNLRALEEEKFNQLPGGVFNRGFVRAYARFLGIDEEHIVAEYEAASQETESAREQKLISDLSKTEVKRPDDQEISLEPRSQWGSIAIIVLVAVIAYAGYNYYQRKKVEREHPPAPVASEQLAQPSAPSITDSQTPPSPQLSGTETEVPPASGNLSSTTSASEKAGEPATSAPPTSPPNTSSPTPPAAAAITVKLRVLEDSWISVKSDGRLLVSGTLSAGMERTYRGNERVEVVLGKAGGVELSYNGKSVDNLSQGPDVRKITFTPSGYE